MRKLFFITGSIEKFNEAKIVIPSLDRVDLDLPEIQELDQRKIIAAKLKAATRSGFENIVVEDTGLYFQSLGYALPGPLIKWFVKSIANEGLISLANMNTDSNQAFALTTIGYLPYGSTEPLYFEGRLDGSVVSPRGSGFGWDAIFLPNGSNLTLGELTTAQKTALSHRGLAFSALQQFISSQDKS